MVQIMVWRQPDDKPLAELLKAWLTDAYASLGLDKLINLFTSSHLLSDWGVCIAVDVFILWPECVSCACL